MSYRIHPYMLATPSTLVNQFAAITQDDGFPPLERVRAREEAPPNGSSALLYQQSPTEYRGFNISVAIREASSPAYSKRQILNARDPLYLHPARYINDTEVLARQTSDGSDQTTAPADGVYPLYDEFDVDHPRANGTKRHSKVDGIRAKVARKLMGYLRRTKMKLSS